MENRHLSSLPLATALGTDTLLYGVQQPGTNPLSVKLTFGMLVANAGAVLRAGDTMSGPLTIGFAGSNGVGAGFNVRNTTAGALSTVGLGNDTGNLGGLVLVGSGFSQGQYTPNRVVLQSNHAAGIGLISQFGPIIFTANDFSNEQMRLANGGNLLIGTPTDAGTGKLQVNGAIAPGGDNLHTLGVASKRWSVVYAGTGTINTSDAREKTAVVGLTADELNAARQLAGELGTFKFLSAIALKGESLARIHVGMTVQRAIEIMQANNLDPFAYGFICFDEWEGAVETGDRYGFRADELLLFVARGFEARLTALEAA